MTKVEFIKAVADKAGFTQKDVAAVIEAEQEIVFDAMAKCEEVKMMDGITLVGVHKDATTARNPKTGDTVAVPAKTAPKAKFGKAVKDALNA